MCVCVCSGGRSFGPGAPGPSIGGCDRAAAVLALLLPFFGPLLPARSVSCGSGSCGGCRGCGCCCCWSLLLHLQHSLCGLVWSLPEEPSQPLATHVPLCHDIAVAMTALTATEHHQPHYDLENPSGFRVSRSPSSEDHANNFHCKMCVKICERLFSRRLNQ